jgi:DNA-binding NarL/FixJ family response regulator
MTIEVLIVGINQLVRAGVRMILQSQSDFLIVGESDSASKALEIAGREHPDVILIDIDVLVGEIDKLTGSLQKAAEDCLILVLSDLKDEELTRKALYSGAAGVVLKIQPPAVLITIIQSLISKKRQVETQQTQRVSIGLNPVRHPEADKHESERFKSLTLREREIINLIGKGLKNRDIAGRLCISETTVRHHLTSVFSKLDVSDRQKLLIWVHQCGFVDLTDTSDVLTRRG